MGTRRDIALIQRVQHGMAGAVGHRAGAHGRRAAVVPGHAAEGALIDLAVIQAVERHAVVFQFDHRLVGLAAHELDRILVTEVIRALDRVVHVPVPVVLAHVAEAGGDAALRGDGMGTGGKHLGHHRHLEVGMGKLQRGAQTGPAATDDHRIERSPGDAHCTLHKICTAQTA